MPPKKGSKSSGKIVPKKDVTPEESEEDENEDFFSRLFSSVMSQYRRQKFCDATLYAKDDSDPEILKSLKCHSLILCSVVPALKELLLESDDEKHLMFPDLKFSQDQVSNVSNFSLLCRVTFKI